MVGVLEASGHYGADTDDGAERDFHEMSPYVLLACGTALRAVFDPPPVMPMLEAYCEQSRKKASVLAEKLDAPGLLMSHDSLVTTCRASRGWSRFVKHLAVALGDTA